MRRLFLIVLFIVPALAGTALAAQDPDIQQLIERMQALEETVKDQRQEIKVQRGEIEALKTGRGLIRKGSRYEPVAYRSNNTADPEYGVSGEELQDAVKSYLETEQGRELITDASPAKIKAGYKIGKGFYLETLDEKFKLQIKNRIQIRYTYQDSDDLRDTNSFRIPRSRITFAGHAFTKDLTYKVQWGLPAFEGRGRLKDVYVNYRIEDFLRLRGGQFKVPFNRQKLNSSAKLQFVVRALANNEFELGRDIGVMAHATPMNGLFEYDLAMLQGAGINQVRNSNNEFMYAARVAVNPLGKFDAYSEPDLVYEEDPKLALGGAFVWNNGRRMFVRGAIRDFNRNITLRQYTADLRFKWRGFSLLGEFYWRNVGAHAGGTLFQQGSNVGYGYTSQAGYFVPLPYVRKHLEAAGRYSFIEPNTNTSGDREREVGGGAGWYFKGNNNKLQADIMRITRERASSSDLHDMEVRLQYQVIF